MFVMFICQAEWTDGPGFDWMCVVVVDCRSCRISQDYSNGVFRGSNFPSLLVSEKKSILDSSSYT